MSPRAFLRAGLGWAPRVAFNDRVDRTADARLAAAGRDVAP